MSRIAQAFARARAENRAAFIAYLCAGDPDFDTSVGACRALIGAGVDILELGVPFSDPLADGLTNQLAAQRALEDGMTMARVFELASRIREKSQVPIVFYAYYNLVFSNGVEAYVRSARAAGVDGLLTLDLPPEEAAEQSRASKAHGLETVCIVDDGGYPIVLEHMDGARITGPQITRNKAFTAAGHKRTTHLFNRAPGGPALPGNEAFGIQWSFEGRFAVFVGGFPIIVDGEGVGGIGLRGGNGEQDTACGNGDAGSAAGGAGGPPHGYRRGGYQALMSCPSVIARSEATKQSPT